MPRLGPMIAPAPRPVSALLALAVLFGGLLQLIGWCFFGFGMIFVWAFVGNSDLVAQLLFRGATARAEATVTGTVETGASENHVRIHEVRYSYVHEGQPHSGVGYTDEPEAFATGRTLELEVLRAQPERSRVPGLRMKEFGAGSLFTLLFPAIGLGLALAGLPRSLRVLRLLRSGTATTGRLVDRQRTGGSVNERPIFRAIFEFRDQRGMTRLAEAKTHLVERLADEAEEHLLYDPDAPGLAVMLDDLPAKLIIRSDGHLAVGNPFATFFRVLLPLSIIGLHVAVAWFHL
jgi:hypothetical protein